MTISHSPRSPSDRTRREDRHLKFYELRDNLDKRGGAYLWQRGKLTRLPSLDSDMPATFASALNDQGQIVGTSLAAIGHRRPFVWQDGKMTTLATLTGQDTAPFTSVSAINERGQIVGSSYIEVKKHTELHVVMWTRRRSS
ncbi:MAG TPA: hypothetical protein VGR46_05210 [Candidatus Limnocylindria bacterium]|nr:hypothetical protein [Candidatus Limnocylindria bacterium]